MTGKKIPAGGLPGIDLSDPKQLAEFARYVMFWSGSAAILKFPMTNSSRSFVHSKMAAFQHGRPHLLKWQNRFPPLYAFTLKIRTDFILYVQNLKPGKGIVI